MPVPALLPRLTWLEEVNIRYMAAFIICIRKSQTQPLMSSYVFNSIRILDSSRKKSEDRSSKGSYTSNDHLFFTRRAKILTTDRAMILQYKRGDGPPRLPHHRRLPHQQAQVARHDPRVRNLQSEVLVECDNPKLEKTLRQGPPHRYINNVISISMGHRLTFRSLSKNFAALWDGNLLQYLNTKFNRTIEKLKNHL